MEWMALLGCESKTNGDGESDEWPPTACCGSLWKREQDNGERDQPHCKNFGRLVGDGFGRVSG